MIKKTLAIYGGQKVITRKFSRYNSIGSEEVSAAKSVIESGVLSQFLGVWHKEFYGGPKVLEFEKYCAEFFDVKHAITVNSWTSGLIAAVGAIGIEPGDEIIVSPWTMCASATAILHWNAIPVFADIDPQTFCIDPNSIERNISDRTKAIMAIDIFGQPADMDAIHLIAKKYSLKIISDTAQAPGAKYKGKFAGTLADIGGFSLNYHKHIHTGEGGILVTNDDSLAQKLKLIRNHAEAVVEGIGQIDITNMIGYNFRLGEIECAMGIEQLKKLNLLIHKRQKTAELLTEKLRDLQFLKLPYIQKDSTSVYYTYPMILEEGIGVKRGKIIEALIAEGLEGIVGGYANIHLLPMYQKKIAYGSKGFPWSSDVATNHISYEKGICPVAEKLHDETYLGFMLCLFDLSEDDVELVSQAFHKVWQNLDLLKP